MKAEIHYERALVQYAAECYDDSRASLRLVPPHSGIAYVRAIELEGWLDSAAKNYRSAQAAFVRALAALDECEVLDMSLRASLVHVLSKTMAEFDSNNVDRLIKEADRVSWTQNLVREQVQTLRHIGLVHRRSGREDDAMRLFGEASSIEPGSPWQVITLAECAWLCVDRDDSVGATGYVAAAQCLVDQINWATVLAEQRVALLVLAQAVARLGDGVAAGRLVELFCSARRLRCGDSLHNTTTIGCRRTCSILRGSSKPHAVRPGALGHRSLPRIVLGLKWDTTGRRSMRLRASSVLIRDGCLMRFGTGRATGIVRYCLLGRPLSLSLAK